ncbi:MAG: hypothetical protein HGA19_00595 [Oscillochloris sp.]|nr:hypothetical protein [Oscillochloris sp.]
MTINFEQMLFDAVVDSKLLYSPKIEIKPAHLANGLFRAICGAYANAPEQHQVLYPKAYPKPDHEFFADPKHARARELIYALFAADATMFAQVNVSSYTLSHLSHITNDNHDRRTGEWLTTLLSHPLNGSVSPALTLLHQALTQEPWRRSDELSVLTLPLVKPESEALHPFKRQLSRYPSDSLVVDSAGIFTDPLLGALRTGFDRLASYEEDTLAYGGKLDLLRRMVVWGCLAIYLHLANSGRDNLNKRLPIVLSLVQPSTPTLLQASVQSYQWVGRSIDRFFRQSFLALIEQWAEVGSMGSWDTDADIEQHIASMAWKGQPARQSRDREEEYRQRCRIFYNSYRSDAAGQTPRVAFANAVTDMLDAVLSSSPVAVARGLGVRIGLLTASRQRTQKLYTPVPDLLEVLVRASVPPQEEWKLTDLASYWVNQYGFLFGALGDENDYLSNWNISSIDGAELQKNADAFVEILALSGYAHRYADGVVLISGRQS